MSTIVGYIVSVREIELGFGDRPDGYLIAKEKEHFEDFTKSSPAFDRKHNEFSVLNSEPKFCQLSVQAEKELEKNTVIWINNKDFSAYVLKY